MRSMEIGKDGIHAESEMRLLRRRLEELSAERDDIRAIEDVVRVGDTNYMRNCYWVGDYQHPDGYTMALVLYHPNSQLCLVDMEYLVPYEVNEEGFWQGK